jgi:ABC-type dipeptide/oligopeptide/nickel transport system permease component
VVVVAIATVIGSLVADILYAVLDPRVRFVSS